MSKLKELTWAHHQAAERRAFAKELIKGNIDPYKYYLFLVCQWHNYKALEDATRLPSHLEPIKRQDRIKVDIAELEDMYPEFKTRIDERDLPASVDEYVKHIEKLKEEAAFEKLIAHMYTRHFGELHGGQIIKKNVPGSGRMYEFDVDKKELIEEFRKLLHDGMADEAKICFDFASKLFDELSNWDG